MEKIWPTGENTHDFEIASYVSLRNRDWSNFWLRRGRRIRVCRPNDPQTAHSEGLNSERLQDGAGGIRLLERCRPSRLLVRASPGRQVNTITKSRRQVTSCTYGGRAKSTTRLTPMVGRKKSVVLPLHLAKKSGRGAAEIYYYYYYYLFYIMTFHVIRSYYATTHKNKVTH